MLSGAKRNRNISGFCGRLGFLASLGMTLGICEIFNAQVLSNDTIKEGFIFVDTYKLQPKIAN